MSANAIASKMTRAMALGRVSRREIGTKSASVAASSMSIGHSSAIIDAATVELASASNPSFTKAPPCGWDKTVVSSSISMPANDSTCSSIEDVSEAKKELEKTAELEGLKLEVNMEELQRLAQLRCTPLKLRDMYKYAIDFNNQEQRLLNAQFLHKELPIRIAQRAVDLLTLPHGLSDALPIRQIAHVYLLYLEKFQEYSVPTTAEEEERFTDTLQSIFMDRSSIPIAIARGVDEWLKNDLREDIELDQLQEMEDALYRFFTARVGLRFLTEHHILSSPSRDTGSAVRKTLSTVLGDTTNDQPFLGCIQTDCCPTKEVRKVAESVANQTEEYYGICPEIQIVESTMNSDSKFTYVPHHLHYMVGELLKNSCRATVRKYLESEANGEKTQIPPIRVVIVKGEEDVTIKIADRGGGIPRSNNSSIWKFAHSTAGEEESTSYFAIDDEGTKIRGFGLPLARIYARYLGGELTLKSTEGYGLDAYLHLPRLGDACENLPLPVKFSPGELTSHPPNKKSARDFSTFPRRMPTIAEMLKETLTRQPE
jgi:pyruvate dehydrogenase kinase 2/3/4